MSERSGPDKISNAMSYRQSRRELFQKIRMRMLINPEPTDFKFPRDILNPQYNRSIISQSENRSSPELEMIDIYEQEGSARMTPRQKWRGIVEKYRIRRSMPHDHKCTRCSRSFKTWLELRRHRMRRHSMSMRKMNMTANLVELCGRIWSEKYAKATITQVIKERAMHERQGGAKQGEAVPKVIQRMIRDTIRREDSIKSRFRRVGMFFPANYAIDRDAQKIKTNENNDHSYTKTRCDMEGCPYVAPYPLTAGEWIDHASKHARDHGPLKCSQCSFSTSDNDEFYEHVMAHRKKNARTKSSKRNYIYKIKKKGGRVIGRWFEPDMFDTVPVFECASCPFAASNRSRFWQHNRHHEMSDSGFACSACTFSSMYRSRIQTHVLLHRNGSDDGAQVLIISNTKCVEDLTNWKKRDESEENVNKANCESEHEEAEDSTENDGQSMKLGKMVERLNSLGYDALLDGALPQTSRPVSPQSSIGSSASCYAGGYQLSDEKRRQISMDRERAVPIYRTEMRTTTSDDNDDHFWISSTGNSVLNKSSISMTPYHGMGRRGSREATISSRGRPSIRQNYYSPSPKRDQSTDEDDGSEWTPDLYHIESSSTPQRTGRSYSRRLEALEKAFPKPTRDESTPEVPVKFEDTRKIVWSQELSRQRMSHSLTNGSISNKALLDWNRKPVRYYSYNVQSSSKSSHPIPSRDRQLLATTSSGGAKMYQQRGEITNKKSEPEPEPTPMMNFLLQNMTSSGILPDRQMIDGEQLKNLESLPLSMFLQTSKNMTLMRREIVVKNSSQESQSPPAVTMTTTAEVEVVEEPEVATATPVEVARTEEIVETSFPGMPNLKKLVETFQAPPSSGPLQLDSVPNSTLFGVKRGETSTSTNPPFVNVVYRGRYSGRRGGARGGRRGRGRGRGGRGIVEARIDGQCQAPNLVAEVIDLTIESENNVHGTHGTKTMNDDMPVLEQNLEHENVNEEKETEKKKKKEEMNDDGKSHAKESPETSNEQKQQRQDENVGSSTMKSTAMPNHSSFSAVTEALVAPTPTTIDEPIKQPKNGSKTLSPPRRGKRGRRGVHLTRNNNQTPGACKAITMEEENNKEDSPKTAVTKTSENIEPSKPVLNRGSSHPTRSAAVLAKAQILKTSKLRPRPYERSKPSNEKEVPKEVKPNCPQSESGTTTSGVVKSSRKEYACDMDENCPFVTPHSSVFRNHRRFHSGGFPFECTQCSYSTPSIDTYRIHRGDHVETLLGKRRHSIIRAHCSKKDPNGKSTVQAGPKTLEEAFEPFKKEKRPGYVTFKCNKPGCPFTTTNVDLYYHHSTKHSQNGLLRYASIQAAQLQYRELIGDESRNKRLSQEREMIRNKQREKARLFGHSLRRLAAKKMSKEMEQDKTMRILNERMGEMADTLISLSQNDEKEEELNVVMTEKMCPEAEKADLESIATADLASSSFKNGDEVYGESTENIEISGGISIENANENEPQPILPDERNKIRRDEGKEELTITETKENATIESEVQKPIEEDIGIRDEETIVLEMSPMKALNGIVEAEKTDDTPEQRDVTLSMNELQTVRHEEIESDTRTELEVENGEDNTNKLDSVISVVMSGSDSSSHLEMVQVSSALGKIAQLSVPIVPEGLSEQLAAEMHDLEKNEPREATNVPQDMSDQAAIHVQDGKRGDGNGIEEDKELTISTRTVPHPPKLDESICLSSTSQCTTYSSSSTDQLDVPVYEIHDHSDVLDIRLDFSVPQSPINESGNDEQISPAEPSCVRVEASLDDAHALNFFPDFLACSSVSNDSLGAPQESGEKISPGPSKSQRVPISEVPPPTKAFTRGDARRSDSPAGSEMNTDGDNSPGQAQATKSGSSSSRVLRGVAKRGLSLVVEIPKFGTKRPNDIQNDPTDTTTSSKTLPKTPKTPFSKALENARAKLGDVTFRQMMTRSAKSSVSDLNQPTGRETETRSNVETKLDVNRNERASIKKEFYATRSRINSSPTKSSTKPLFSQENPGVNEERKPLRARRAKFEQGSPMMEFSRSEEVTSVACGTRSKSISRKPSVTSERGAISEYEGSSALRSRTRSTKRGINSQVALSRDSLRDVAKAAVSRSPRVTEDKPKVYSKKVSVNVVKEKRERIASPERVPPKKSKKKRKSKKKKNRVSERQSRNDRSEDCIARRTRSKSRARSSESDDESDRPTGRRGRRRSESRTRRRHVSESESDVGEADQYLEISSDDEVFEEDDNEEPPVKRSKPNGTPTQWPSEFELSPHNPANQMRGQGLADRQWNHNGLPEMGRYGDLHQTPQMEQMRQFSQTGMHQPAQNREPDRPHYFTQTHMQDTLHTMTWREVQMSHTQCASPQTMFNQTAVHGHFRYEYQHQHMGMAHPPPRTPVSPFHMPYQQNFLPLMDLPLQSYPFSHGFSSLPPPQPLHFFPNPYFNTSVPPPRQQSPPSFPTFSLSGANQPTSLHNFMGPGPSQGQEFSSSDRPAPPPYFSRGRR